MKKMPKISIVMPVYNGGKYIKETVESVLAQTFSDFELLVIDDGSTDETFSIINGFADRRIRYVKNEKNSGIVFSLNRGLSLADGDYIARIDADDICYADRLRMQYDFMEANREVGVCSGDIDLIDSDGVGSGFVRFPTTNEECIMKFLFGNPIVHPASMFRKSLAIEAGGYTAGTEPAEDLDFWMKLANLAQIRNVDKTLIRYRVHANNYSKVKRDQYVGKLQEIYSKGSLKKIDGLIDDDFLQYHIRIIIGNWNEKSGLREIVGLRSWKKSLLANNRKLSLFADEKFKREIDYNITLILLSAIKSGRNSLSVKVVSACYLALFNPLNILKIIRSKQSK